LPAQSYTSQFRAHTTSPQHGRPTGILVKDCRGKKTTRRTGVLSSRAPGILPHAVAAVRRYVAAVPEELGSAARGRAHGAHAGRMSRIVKMKM